MKAIKITNTVELIDIPNELHDLQKAVDGNIEVVPLNPRSAIVVDEEGILKGRQYNALASMIARFGLYGTALIVGIDGEEMCDVPEDYICILALDEKEKGCTEQNSDTAAHKHSHCYHTTEKEDCQVGKELF